MSRAFSPDGFGSEVDLRGLILSEDTWLTGVLGRPCWNAADAGDSVYPRFVTQSQTEAMLTARLPVEETGLLTKFLNRGFRLIEIGVQLRRAPLTSGDDRPGYGNPQSQQEYQVLMAGPEDQRWMEVVAKQALTTSRFHSDSQIPPLVAARVKEEWARNLARGVRGAFCLKALVTGRHIGFLGVTRSQSRAQEAVIDLIAVDPAYQGLGAGSALLMRFHAYCDTHGLSSVVGTQLRNTRAIRLYQSHGYLLDESHYILHAHARIERAS